MVEFWEHRRHSYGYYGLIIAIIVKVAIIIIIVEKKY